MKHPCKAACTTERFRDPRPEPRCFGVGVGSAIPIFRNGPAKIWVFHPPSPDAYQVWAKVFVISNLKNLYG